MGNEAAGSGTVIVCGLVPEIRFKTPSNTLELSVLILMYGLYATSKDTKRSTKLQQEIGNNESK
jgi:hypothetical protein